MYFVNENCITECIVHSALTHQMHNYLNRCVALQIKNTGLITGSSNWQHQQCFLITQKVTFGRNLLFFFQSFLLSRTHPHTRSRTICPSSKSSSLFSKMIRSRHDVNMLSGQACSLTLSLSHTHTHTHTHTHANKYTNMLGTPR